MSSFRPTIELAADDQICDQENLDMPNTPPTRRDVLKAGVTSATAGLLAISAPGFAFPNQQADEELVPFLDEPRTGTNRLDWETLDSWLTPQDQVFNVQHYGIPEFNLEDYRLEITGLVEHPKPLTLPHIQALPRKDVLMTLECSGNGSSKGFMNAVYNSKWTGTPLVPLLNECGVRPEAIEAVFIGHDRQEETLRKGTNRELTFEVPFGRSLSLDDVTNMNLLLAYERNDQPLEHRNGAPLA